MGLLSKTVQWLQQNINVVQQDPLIVILQLLKFALK